MKAPTAWRHAEEVGGGGIPVPEPGSDGNVLGSTRQAAVSRANISGDYGCRASWERPPGPAPRLGPRPRPQTPAKKRVQPTR